MNLSGFFDDNCACNRDGSNYCESNDAVVGSYGSFGLGGGIGGYLPHKASISESHVNAAEV